MEKFQPEGDCFVGNEATPSSRQNSHPRVGIFPSVPTISRVRYFFLHTYRFHFTYCVIYDGTNLLYLSNTQIFEDKQGERTVPRYYQSAPQGAPMYLCFGANVGDVNDVMPENVVTSGDKLKFQVRFLNK